MRHRLSILFPKPHSPGQDSAGLACKRDGAEPFHLKVYTRHFSDLRSELTKIKVESLFCRKPGGPALESFSPCDPHAGPRATELRAHN